MEFIPLETMGSALRFSGSNVLTHLGKSDVSSHPFVLEDLSTPLEDDLLSLELDDVARDIYLVSLLTRSFNESLMYMGALPTFAASPLPSIRGKSPNAL
jgi:hypothetical protein